MNDREMMIAEIQEGLRSGLITEADIRSLIHEPVAAPVMAPMSEVSAAKSERLSAVDVMFYVAGIVLYAAVMSVIGQTWGSDDTVLHILLSAGVGMALWFIAYYLIRNGRQTDIQKGLINALLLTGSLSVVTGGYIISNQLVEGFGEVNFIAGAVTLVSVGALHLAFDRLIRRDMTLLMGVLFCVAAFPALLFGILQDADAPGDIWSMAVIISAGLLVYATRVVAKLNPARETVRRSFDAFAAFLTLVSMYISSFGEYGALWLIGLIIGVLGIFYLSVLSQNRHLLGNASFFLVLTVITISFKYFAGFGVTTSLILATIGLLASAAVASGVNKRYFKRPVGASVVDY